MLRFVSLLPNMNHNGFYMTAMSTFQRELIVGTLRFSLHHVMERGTKRNQPWVPTMERTGNAWEARGNHLNESGLAGKSHLYQWNIFLREFTVIFQLTNFQTITWYMYSCYVIKVHLVQSFLSCRNCCWILQESDITFHWLPDKALKCR